MNSWDANAAAWTEAVRTGAIPSRRAGTDAAVVRAVRELGAGRVLDAGCGEGWLARALAGLGCEVVGFDGSAELVQRARAAGGGEFHVLDYADLVRDPTALGGPYGAVVCNFSLLDEEVRPVLRALASTLSRDGAVVIQTVHPWVARGEEPYRDGWRTERWEAFGSSFQEPMPWFYRTVESWLRVIRDCDLRLVDLREPMDPPTGVPLSLLMVIAR